MMLALVWEGPRQMNLREMPTPQPADDEVLIEVGYSGICGSELGGYLGHNSLRKPPLVMGHEFAGTIVEAGNRVATIKPQLRQGMRVAVNPLIHQPGSRASLAGRQNLDRNRKIIGIHRPGSFAQYVTAPAANVYPIPDSMTIEHAALAEPMACAVRAARMASVTATDSVLITGLGPIGLLTLQVVKAAGARRIYATDTDADRRAIGATFGVRVIDPRPETAGGESVVDLIRSECNGEGVEAAIDAVGANATRKECIQAVAWGGRVVFTGLHDEESPIPANYIIRSEISIHGSFAYTSLDFENALQWLIDGRTVIDEWIEKQPLGEGGASFERLLSKPGPVAKILLHL